MPLIIEFLAVRERTSVASLVTFVEMILEVCLVLRIILNENQHFSLEEIIVSPCKATKDPASSKDVQPPAGSAKDVSKLDSVGSNPILNSLWVYQPEAHGYFEPFERRPKPVTLVAFRKNGLLPRTKTNTGDGKSGEVAELQSPFNDISNFWVDD
ncbi:uncharacterized protein LOC135086819 isoform X4 [Ostrinia nubilalis]|uniref:uncharacterized protein LOC135086819 isoform X4 n=1 Tax=Ostrinia nubilalis TaxID=29057 RepID=UPI0030825ED9